MSKRVTIKKGKAEMTIDGDVLPRFEGLGWKVKSDTPKKKPVVESTQPEEATPSKSSKKETDK